MFPPGIGKANHHLVLHMASFFFFFTLDALPDATFSIYPANPPTITSRHGILHIKICLNQLRPIYIMYIYTYLQWFKIKRSSISFLKYDVDCLQLRSR